MSNPGSKYVRALKPDARANNGTVAGGLAYALQHGLSAFQQYKMQEEAKEKQAQQKATLSDMLRGQNRAALPTEGQMGPTVDAASASPFQNPDGLASSLLSDNPAMQQIGLMQYQKAMNPPKPEAYTLGPGQQRFVGGQQVASVPATPEKPQLTKAADGYMYNAQTVQRAFPNVQKEPDKAEGFKQEEKLRKEFVAATDDFVKVRDAFGRISASAQDPSAAGDLALVFNFMKVLDPGSVVREGEFATASSAAGVPEQVYGLYNRVLRGERLTPDQRGDFVNRAGRLYESQQKFYGGLQDRYSSLAEAYGLDPSRVVYDMGALSPQRSVQPEIGINPVGGEPLQTEVFSFSNPEEVGVADFASVQEYLNGSTEADLDALPDAVRAALAARMRAGQ